MTKHHSHENRIMLVALGILSFIALPIALAMPYLTYATAPRFNVGDCIQPTALEDWDLSTKSRIMRIGRLKYKLKQEYDTETDDTIDSVDLTYRKVDCGAAFL